MQTCLYHVHIQYLSLFPNLTDMYARVTTMIIYRIRPGVTNMMHVKCCTTREEHL